MWRDGGDCSCRFYSRESRENPPVGGNEERRHERRVKQRQNNSDCEKSLRGKKSEGVGIEAVLKSGSVTFCFFANWGCPRSLPSPLSSFPLAQL